MKRLLAVVVCFCLLYVGNLGHAHLLNMSKARIALLEGGRLEVRLSLDLLVEAESRERYHAFSQSPEPLADPQIHALLKPLPAAIELVIGNQRIPLKLESAEFPDVSKEEFLNPLSWPRTDLVLTAEPIRVAPSGADGSLHVRYGTGFRFEHPTLQGLVWALDRAVGLESFVELVLGGAAMTAVYGATWIAFVYRGDPYLDLWQMVRARLGRNAA